MAVAFGMYHNVTVVRKAGERDEERRDDVRVGGSLDHNILFHPDVDIKPGDQIHSPALHEPRVVDDTHPHFASSGITHYEADLVPLSDYEAFHQPVVPTMVNQTVFGNVGKLAGRDITELNINAVTLLDILAKALDENEDIPAQEKRTLLDKIAELRNNPYIVGVGSGLILKLLEQLLP